MIERKEYLKKLEDFRNTKIIKVVTGIRRCGKFTLLNIFKEKLKNEGVEEK